MKFDRHQLAGSTAALFLAAALIAVAATTAGAVQTITYTYDAIGRLTSAAYDAGMTITYQYDASGNITRIQAASGTGLEPANGAPGVPTTFALDEARPNPFAGAAALAFQLPRESDVRLELYDVSGRRVRSLVQERRPAGYHTALWDGRDESGGRVASGIYFLRMQASAFDQTRRLVVIK